MIPKQWQHFSLLYPSVFASTTPHLILGQTTPDSTGLLEAEVGGHILAVAILLPQLQYHIMK